MVIRPTVLLIRGEIGRDESRPYGGFFGGERGVVIFALPPTRQIFTIRDAVGAQFIAPMLVREASDTAGLMRGETSIGWRSRCTIRFGPTVLLIRGEIGRDESRPYGGVFGGEQRVVIFTLPPTRQIFTIRDAVGAQFIAPKCWCEKLPTTRG